MVGIVDSTENRGVGRREHRLSILSRRQLFKENILCLQARGLALTSVGVVFTVVGQLSPSAIVSGDFKERKRGI
jgi:hypothetical protein